MTTQQIKDRINFYKEEIAKLEAQLSTSNNRGGGEYIQIIPYYTTGDKYIQWSASGQTSNIKYNLFINTNTYRGVNMPAQTFQKNTNDYTSLYTNPGESYYDQGMKKSNIDPYGNYHTNYIPCFFPIIIYNNIK